LCILAPIPLCRPIFSPHPLGSVTCKTEFRRILDLFHRKECGDFEYFYFGN